MANEEDDFRVQRVLHRITYKQNWSIAYQIHKATEHFFIQWIFVVNGQQHRGRKWYVSPHATDSEIVQTALMAVIAAEEHEAREHFLVDGQAIFGPHHDVNALIDIKQDVRSPPPTLSNGEPRIC